MKGEPNMGRMQAEGMREMLDEETALRWHLQHNHYPPISDVFIPICQQVIGIAADAFLTEDGDLWAEEIELPNGKMMRVDKIYDDLHLDTFVQARLAEMEE
jgi:hypothetical protein